MLCLSVKRGGLHYKVIAPFYILLFGVDCGAAFLFDRMVT